MSPLYKNVLRGLSIPITLLILSLIYSTLWQFFNLPKSDELLQKITSFFNQYGLIVVLLASFIEGILIVGNYFPGGIVIFITVIAAGGDITLVVRTVAMVSVGFFFAYAFNYIIGKHGWYRVLVKFGMKRQLASAQEKLNKHSLNAIILSYWQPNLAAVTSTAAGILNINLKRFLFESTLGIAIWNSFWGTLVAIMGKSALEIVTTWKYVFIILSIWICIIIIKEYIKYKKQFIGENRPSTI